MSNLNKDPALVKIMEDDLRAKIQVAIDADPQLRMVVHGVFSIDDLEKKMESELNGNIGVGVQYMGCSRVSRDAGSSNVGKGNAAVAINFNFNVILGVPSTDCCDERHSATRLLTTLRQAIFGKQIGEDRIQRTWEFVAERPEVGASSNTMLYYAQVWQVAMLNIGTAT